MIINKFSQIGKRENNEDFLGNNNNVIIVCDGMGGHTAGEIASKFVVEKMLLYTQNEFSKENIQNYLNKVQQELNQLLEKNPEQAKMGTTFTALFKSNNAFYIAHIGDSRVYFVRPSKKNIWHTWDHSLVGELTRTKEITREAARHHSMSNRISRAITANQEDKTAKADIVKIDELEKGDVFLLCTDGVSEAWQEHELTRLLCDTNLSLNKKTEIIKQQCDKLSKDNNTAYLIEIEDADVISVGNNAEINWFSQTYFDEDYKKYLQTNKITIEKNNIEKDIISENNIELKKELRGLSKNKKIVIIVLLLIVLAIFLFA